MPACTAHCLLRGETGGKVYKNSDADFDMATARAMGIMKSRDIDSTQMVRTTLMLLPALN